MSSQEIWSNENVLLFLELYQAEPVLWNPVVKDHKNRNAVADAWQRIQVSLGLKYGVADLKRKRESLMSTYRLYTKEIKDSIRSGASSDEIYKPNWFAYEFMDNFLGPLYNKMTNTTINTETGAASDQSERMNVLQEGNDRNENISPATSKTKKRPAPELVHAKKQMDEAVDVLKTISQKSNREPDEVDLFCQLLAKKIKKFNEEEREDIMHDIDETLYNRRKRSENKSRSSTHSFSSLPSTSSISVQQRFPSPYSGSQIPPYSPGESTEVGFCAPQSQPVTILSSNIIQEAFTFSQ